jgi:hypothetical protein
VGLSLKLSDATSQSTCLSRPTNFRNDHSKAVARNKGKEHKNNCQLHWDRFVGYRMASNAVLFPGGKNPDLLKQFPHQGSNRTEKTPGQCDGADRRHAGYVATVVPNENVALVIVVSAVTPGTLTIFTLSSKIPLLCYINIKL